VRFAAVYFANEEGTPHAKRPNERKLMKSRCLLPAAPNKVFPRKCFAS
jgi:hypothetical protein